jgi:redox-sensitive bicupin YhaK (pirin superfamily)
VKKIQQQQLDQKEVINKNRSINKIVNSLTTTEGEGFLVNRSFPTDSISYIDPFLLLDEMGPIDFKPGEAKGATDHPHRGFETVTYLIEGIFEHKDSSGNSGKLNAGDIQWMTAGSGVIHSEMPEVEFRKKGGRLHGFQLWVNLPKKDKMTNPNYQDIPSSEIPVVKLVEDSGHVKVIAGEAFDVKSTIRTKIPIQYLHFTLNPGSKIIHHLQSNYNAFVYIISGEGTFGDDEKYAKRGNVIIFNNDGENIEIKSFKDANEPLQFLLIAGVPLNEPVARYGPFVMNTKSEIYKAIKDYRDGRLGAIAH